MLLIFIISRSAGGSRRSPADRPLDILVNDAGYLGGTTAFVDHAHADWRRIVEVNLLGAMLVTQAVLPIMIRQRAGRIVNLGSLAGKEGLAGLAAYSAASAGVISFTKALSREVAQYNVFVNCVAPGPIDISGTARWAGSATRAKSPTWSPGCAARRAASTPERSSTCPAAARGIERRRRPGWLDRRDLFCYCAFPRASVRGAGGGA